jgi:hypothetical protein
MPRVNEELGATLLANDAQAPGENRDAGNTDDAPQVAHGVVPVPVIGQPALGAQPPVFMPDQQPSYAGQPQLYVPGQMVLANGQAAVHPRAGVPCSCFLGSEPHDTCNCCYKSYWSVSLCGWLCAAVLGVIFFLTLLLPTARFVVVCATFGINALWLRPWWKQHREDANLDMLIKIFCFIFTFGVVIAITAELIAGEVYTLIFLPSDEDVSEVTGGPCAISSAQQHPRQCAAMIAQTGAAQKYLSDYLDSHGYWNTTMVSAKTIFEQDQCGSLEGTGAYAEHYRYDAEPGKSCPWAHFCSKAAQNSWAGSGSGISEIPKFCPGLSLLSHSDADCPPNLPHKAVDGSLDGFEWVHEQVKRGKVIEKLIESSHTFCFGAEQLEDALQHNCSMVHHLQKMQSPGAMVGAGHVGLRVLLFLVANGFLQAGLTEETVKLMSALGARCPCCLQNQGGCPWFPCCIPGTHLWTRDARGGGLTNPYSLIIYMVAAAAGFSTVENIEYLFLAGSPEPAFPKCFAATPELSMTRINAICGRLLLAYPLHLICGALTGVQLVRHKFLGLRWWWLLLPAVLTHGFYDTVLFFIGTISVGSGGVPPPEPAHGPDMQPVAFEWASLLMYPVAWAYLAVPVCWITRQLRALDLPSLKERGAIDGEGGTTRDGQQGDPAPPVAVVAAPPLESAPAPMAQDLSQVLSAAHLSHYESALRELGCEVPAHLEALEEQDLVELGMKKLEAKRLLRTARA